MNIQYVKKKLGIKNRDIAKIFSYANTSSYESSARRSRTDNGIIEIYKLSIKSNLNK